MSELIQLIQTPLGIQFVVRVTPSAKRTLVAGNHDHALRVAVTAASEKGKANKAVVDAVSKSLGIRRNQCTVVAGLTSRCKTLLVQGIDLAELRQRIEPLASP